MKSLLNKLLSVAALTDRFNVFNFTTVTITRLGHGFFVEYKGKDLFTAFITGRKEVLPKMLEEVELLDVDFWNAISKKLECNTSLSYSLNQSKLFYDFVLNYIGHHYGYYPFRAKLFFQNDQTLAGILQMGGTTHELTIKGNFELVNIFTTLVEKTVDKSIILVVE